MLFELVRKPRPNDMRVSADAFAYFEYGMTFVGWLPPPLASRYRNLYMMFRGLVIMWSLIYLPFGLITSYVRDIKSYNPSELLTSLQACINDFGCSIKVLIFYRNLWRCLEGKKLLNRLDAYCLDGSDRCRIHYWVKRCNIVYIIYQIVYTNYALSTFLTATLNGMAPWRVYNPLIDWQSSTRNLWIASTWEYLILGMAVMQNQLVDVFSVIYCLMLRVHIKILLKRVRQLRTNSEETEQTSYDELVKCIEHHKLILEYSELMRSLVSRTTLIQFLLIGMILGCTLVNLFFFSDFWIGLACVLYIIGVMFQTFPFCYTCDLIIDDCHKLSVAIFHSNWIGSSRRYRTTLIQFLGNAQKPISYTAGSVFPICMQTNIKVAKLAFSVVTFVKQLNIAEKLMEN